MKLMLSTFLIILLTFIANSLFAQQSQYDDVGVIVNTNDSVSIAIADYFMIQRSIPAENRINIQVPAKEEINQEEFDSLRTQIEAAMTSQNLFNKLNYLVTTKGVPLKILRNDPDPQGCNASVESELMLLHPMNNLYIGLCSSGSQIFNGDYFGNPYFNAQVNFSSYLYGMYLVTRLDAYTFDQVKSLIDRSGPLTFVNKDSVQFVFDQAKNFKNNSLDQAFVSSDEMLRGRGWKVFLNTDSVFVTGKDSVLGYASWGSNDDHADSFTVHAKPLFSWVNGSIAETHVSTSGRSFTSGTEYGQSLIADLIEEGVCGAKGYVYEPFTTAIAISNILFERYTRTAEDGKPLFNLAESYFAASQLIGWMDVVVGDPKTTITSSRSLGLVNYDQEQKGFLVYPNPAKEIVSIRIYGSGKPSKILVRDISGRLLLEKQISTSEFTIDIANLQPGIYLITCMGQTQKLIINR